MNIKFVVISLAVVIGLFALIRSSTYVVQETEQVIITQFGKVVGDPVTDAGLHFKIPLVQDVNRIEKRFLPWDGPASEMSTKKKDFLIIDTFARWRVSQEGDGPKLYFTKLRDERTARSRLDDILGSETRNAVAKHEIIEIIRTTKDRVPERDESLLVSDDANATIFTVLNTGREDVEQEIFETAAPKLKKLGIELLDIRFKRINYNEIVRRQIYASMIKEREKIAKRYRFEGDGEAARIKGEKERQLAVIASEAYKTVEEIRGDADANATAIYSAAYTNKTTISKMTNHTLDDGTPYITITTSSPHGLETGNIVKIAGTKGYKTKAGDPSTYLDGNGTEVGTQGEALKIDTVANGNWSVTDVNASTFTIPKSGNAEYIADSGYYTSPQATEFYMFLKTLETYRLILDRETSLIMTTDSPLFRLLKILDVSPTEEAKP